MDSLLIYSPLINVGTTVCLVILGYYVSHTASKKLEKVKSELAAAIYRQNLGFQKEFEIYEKLWKSLIDLSEAMQEFQPGRRYMSLPDETFEQRGSRLGTILSKASKEFGGSVHYNRPFYSPIMFGKFERFQRFICREAFLYNMEYIGKGDQYLAKLTPKRLDRVIRAMNCQSNKICEAMRQRITALQKDAEGHV